MSHQPKHSNMAYVLASLDAASEMGEFEEPITDNTVLFQFQPGGLTVQLTIGDLRKVFE